MRVWTAAPSTLESRQEPGLVKEDGAEETHHRMGKTEDRAEEVPRPEKEEENTVGIGWQLGSCA